MRTPDIRPGITLDEFVVMPDHFQAIIDIDAEKHQPNKYTRVGAHRGAPCQINNDTSHPSNTEQSLSRAPRSVGSLIAQFKGITTHRINALRDTFGKKVWQRGYYERIIRNLVELDDTRQYIRDNPRHWKE